MLATTMCTSPAPPTAPSTCAARGPSTAATACKSSKGAGRIERPEHRQRGDEFERLLRRKSADREEDGDPGRLQTIGDAAAQPWPGTMPPLAPPAAGSAARAVSAEPAGARGSESQAPSVTAAVLLRPDAGPVQAPAVRTEAGGAWEVSLHEPMGVAVELRATRAEALAPTTAAAPWTLAIAAPGLAHATLMQHAPRLHERLRARAIGEVHIRIERSRQPQRDAGSDQEEST
jgi:hypothetical protein